MSKKQRDAFADFEEQTLRERNAAIGEKVLRDLGRPENLRVVQVSCLWKNHYRVNVYTGDNVASATVANSYFLITNGDGDIIASTPKITRQY